MTAFTVELRSDTKTLPSAGMRAAMAAAPVGDEQLGEDPTVNELCARSAELLGKPAALFLPSGTMCNLIAVLVHCRPGEEIVAADLSHLISSESAGPAAVAGVQIRPIPSERGIFTAEAVRAALRPPKLNAPVSRLVHVEQTVNRGGGTAWSRDALAAVSAAARELGLGVHMDGARILNAVAATGTPARDFGALCDSLWLDLSKGLGCPVGAVLAGEPAFIAAARRWKFRLGGAMRQAGVIAAAGLYALDHNVERLAVDHDNARRLADHLSGLPGLRVGTPETNIVFLDLAEGLDAPATARALAERGVGIDVSDRRTLRAVTHLDVDAAGIDRAAEAIAAVVRGT
jgi:threonine aldolase